MLSNLVTAIQKKMSLGSFNKIDPNVEQGKKELEASPSTDHYLQAATIAVLVGLYKYGNTIEGAEELSHPEISNNNNNLLDKIYADRTEEIIGIVSEYGDQTVSNTRSLMTEILHSALEIMHEEIGGDASPDQVTSFLSHQRHHILVYLPPDLHMGEVVKDSTIEDRTNKMEGPVSGLINFFQDFF